VLRIGDACTVYKPAARATARKSMPESAETDEKREKIARNDTAPAGGEKLVHTVARGHNPTTIARRYGVKVSDLFKWNGWQRSHVLQIGDKVVVFK
jgi:LysM repeat protein